MNFFKSAIKGVYWTFLDLLINKALYFITTILLARVLGPTEFGLIGMITVFIAIGNSLIEGGMSTSILKMKSPLREDFSTVFWANVFVSILVYVIVFICSSYIAQFYKEPILENVIKIYSLGFIIISFKSIHIVRLTVNMKFKEITLFNMPGNIISSVVAIYLAYNGWGIWSLVVLFLLNQIISTIVYWIGVKWSPDLLFDKKLFLRHFKFGYKLMLSSQLNVIFDNLNNILIGKFFNAKMLGYYERAFTLNSYPISIFSSIISKVTLPFYAKIKDKKEEVLTIFKKSLEVISFFSFIVSGLLFLISNDLIKGVLGDEWLTSIPIFNILIFSFAFYPVHTLNINMLNLYGRSDLFLKIEIIKKIFAIIIVFFAIQYGILGLVYGNVIISIFSLYVNISTTSRIIMIGNKEQFFLIMKNFLIILISAILKVFFMNIEFESNILLSILFKSFVYIISLVLFSELIKLPSYLLVKKYLIKINR
ncbi:lipopolysaccharide biosynthesis protein [Tenacibaculum halocynthiae]|uniref:lipopolysaccharide biosynthesis protein n=1 Tax=Tenacibaculum halocynthiae TaxID=1254437 RepID=UPI003893BC4E